MSKKHLPWAGVASRFTAYSLVIFGSVFALTPAAEHRAIDLFQEGSPLESIQLAVLIVTALTLLLTGRRCRGGALSGLLATLPALAAVRELDRVFDDWIPHLGWQLPFSVILLATVVHGWLRRAAVLQAAPELVDHRSFGILWAGFVAAVPFAQLIGHGALLEALFNADYPRGYKRFLEESVELFGYFLIFVGSIEWSIHVALGRARHPSGSFPNRGFDS